MNRRAGPPVPLACRGIMPPLRRVQIPEGRRKWWVLLTMTGSLSMILIDQTVVSVALPAIQRDLDVSQTQLQ